MRLFTIFLISVFSFGTSSMVFAADDPSIKGKPRTSSQKAMTDHIEQNKINNEYVIYDDISGKLLLLELTKLHSGIVKKGDFYVSCADFTDSQGNTYDLDFFVTENNGNYRVYDAIVHSVNGEKRKYHLEH